MGPDLLIIFNFIEDELHDLYYDKRPYVSCMCSENESYDSHIFWCLIEEWIGLATWYCKQVKGKESYDDVQWNKEEGREFT